MRQLEALVRQAEAEVSRQMQVCNACRYCESFCAVFPAMTRRLSFDAANAHYLANLCHNCGACLHACQYAPPHEFGINVPKAMAVVRRETYAIYAWPDSFGGLYRRNGLTVALATAAGLALFLAIAAMTQGDFFIARPEGNFYTVFPHKLLVLMFSVAFGWAIVALAVGATRFWRAQSPGPLAPGAAGEATRNALGLTYLGGGHGEGCNEESDRFTLARRRLHHFTFYGFMLCFASTCVATLYHYVLGAPAPYAFTSLPVILGTLGGIGLLIGPTGLFVLYLRRHPQHGDPAQRPMDLGFIALLFFTSLTGLTLLVLRGTALMPLLLSVHLGLVMALFVTLPYGKFAHAVYRCAALLKWAIERRQPSRIHLGAD